MKEIQKNRLSANAKRALKLALDAVMLVLLVLMYKKQVISLSFHEIGGLALIGLFVIHHLVNGRWIKAVTAKLFSKSTPTLVRARYIVDVLLLVSFLTVGVTGVLINKTLFEIRVAGNAKALHYFSAAVSVILMGVHLGLHAEYLFGKVFRCKAKKIAKLALGVVLASMIAFGGYSLFTTQFVSFLAAPLRTAQFARGDFQPSGDAMLDGSTTELPDDLSQMPETAGDSAQAPQGGGSGNFSGQNGNGQFASPNGAQGAREGHGEGGSGNAALLIAQYVSIIALFGAATAGIVKVFGKKKSGKGDAEAVAVAAAEQVE
jgi:hypothetical protein